MDIIGFLMLAVLAGALIFIFCKILDVLFNDDGPFN